MQADSSDACGPADANVSKGVSSQIDVEASDSS
jgi:hypothetical protein